MPPRPVANTGVTPSWGSSLARISASIYTAFMTQIIAFNSSFELKNAQKQQTEYLFEYYIATSRHFFIYSSHISAEIARLSAQVSTISAEIAWISAEISNISAEIAWISAIRQITRTNIKLSLIQRLIY